MTTKSGQNPTRIERSIDVCQQCCHAYTHGSYNDGFCCDDCLKQYEKESEDEDAEEEESGEEE